MGSWTLVPATSQGWWSEEMFRLYGLEPSRRPPPVEDNLQQYTPETAPKLAAALRRAVEKGEPYEVAVDLVRPDGAIRHVVCRGECTLGPDGSVDLVHGTVTDVTEDRRAQARLQEAQRAELMGRLAAGVTHEFNNLLMGISGYAEFLARDLSDEDPRRAEVDAIRESGARAASLVRKLQAFGRRRPHAPAPLEIGDLVTGMVPVLASLVGETLEFVTRRAGPPAWCRADRALLEESLTNLVLNARQATPAGGRVTVEVSCVSLEEADPRLPTSGTPGEYARLAVLDTGTGIAPEILPHLFEPFFTTRPLGEASGLGLASVQGAVSQAGGFVTVDSEPGRGSTFAIHLPRLPAGAQVPPPRPEPAALGKGWRVLVVDDEPSVRTLAARMLRRSGCAVVEAGDPRHALAIAESDSTPFDLLLTDIMMPGMNGLVLARRLAALQPGLHVIFMSGYPANRLFEEGYLERGCAYLEKPFRYEDLLRRLRELLQDGEG